MPTQAPRFRPPGWKPRAAWEPNRLSQTRRKRGRAGMRERHQVLAEEPFCRRCMAQGREIAADVVDHIVPLAWGGSDDRGNKQPLCHQCHDAKSLEERKFSRTREPQ